MTDDTTAPGDGERLETHKYRVERLNDPEGKHAGCWYFVLDPHHDPHAVAALRRYAYSVRGQSPALAADIMDVVRRFDPPRAWGVRRRDGVVIDRSGGQPERPWDEHTARAALDMLRTVADNPDAFTLVTRSNPDSEWEDTL